jgi:hypothetical protein
MESREGMEESCDSLAFFTVLSEKDEELQMTNG